MKKLPDAGWLWFLTAGFLILHMGCEKLENVGVEREPAQPPAPAVERPVVPVDAAVAALPEVPAGPVLLTVELPAPGGCAGALAVAGLKHNGSIVAMGVARVPEDGPITLELKGATLNSQLPETDAELWTTINRDDLVSWYPGFGDLHRLDTLAPSPAGRKVVVGPAPAWKERVLSDPANLVTLHYHRYDDEYDNVGIWSWDANQKRSPAQNELFPVGTDEYGLVFQFDRADYGVPGDPQRVGLLPRMAGDWGRKESDDRTWIPGFGNDVFLIGGRGGISRTRPPITPHLTDAYIDTTEILHLDLSHPAASTQVTPDAFEIADDAGVRTAVRTAHLLFDDGKKQSRVVELILATPLDAGSKAYHVRFKGFGDAVQAVPRDLLNDPALFDARGVVLGATCTPQQTVFRVFAPTATAGSVVVYDEAKGDAGRRTIPFHRLGMGVWEAAAPGDLAGKFYAFSLDGRGLVPELEATDIYATNTVDSGRRARLTPQGQTDPPAWQRFKKGPPIASPVDAVIWEIHVRDFTMSPTSGADGKGLYLGFTEAGTHLPGDTSIRTCLDHLVEMGVTHVQLLPVQDFQNEEGPRQFNWGYITNFFNSPEGAYATNPDNESRVREFKQLVGALHQRGIGVILDVVYNHTGTSAAFNQLVPRYYYRMLAGGVYANGSGCGNEFHSEAPMGRKYIIDTLKYWVEEFGIDGFRFDLMALIDIETMRQAEIELRKVNPDILIYGEPWMAAASPVRGPSDKEGIAGTGIGAFNDDFRNALKGSPDGGGAGFIQTGFDRDKVARGIEGSRQLWAKTPAQTINYMTCHDNLVLYDKLKVSMPGADEALLVQATKLGHLLLLTAQGVPFLHAGCEFARTKFGNHNSYDAPDSVNQIDWALKKKNFALYNYVRGLIALRKEHPLFRLRTNEEIANRVVIHHAPAPDTILFTIDGAGVRGEKWKAACILANAHDSEPREFELPAGRWRVAYDANGARQPQSVQGRVTLQPKSGVILSR